MGVVVLLLLLGAEPDAASAANAEEKEEPAKPAAGAEEEEEKPVDVPEPGANERLVKDIAATTGDITLPEIIDEIMGDVVAEIAARPAKTMSPMALRNIVLASNITPSYARKLTAAIVAGVHAGSNVRVVECLECQATRTQVVDGKWQITRGITDAEDARRVADRIGAKSFMDVSFGFDPATGVIEMEFQVVRASDAMIIWADTFRADETTPMLMRSSTAPQKRKDRLRDLEMLLEGRPYYGMMASAGWMLLPYDDPAGGDITGATAGYRIYERFGVDRRVMFGLDLTGFINTERLAGGLISAGSWWIPIRPDLMFPELRLGGKAGAFVAGSEGNAAVFQLGAEVLLRYRFGLYGYALFMTKAQFNNFNLGGLGFATGISFNW